MTPIDVNAEASFLVDDGQGHQRQLSATDFQRPVAIASLVALAHIGTDLEPAQDTPIAPASGRVKINFRHAGDAGRIWVGVGQPAQVGVGDYLDPGDVWQEFNDETIHVLLDGTAEAQRIAGMEWAA